MPNLEAVRGPSEECDEEDLVNFSDKLRNIMQKAELTTKTTLRALDDLESSIDHAKANMADFFRDMQVRERRLRNIRETLGQFETTLTILDHLDHDRLRLVQGPTSMGLEEYVGKLEFLKNLHKFNWFCNYKCSAGYLTKLAAMLRACDTVLANEFTNLLQHYSTLDFMERYIEFIVDEFEASIETSDTKKEDSPLLVPKETLAKMQLISSWFLKLEQEYELFDENNEHCDINKRLKYNEIRLPFLKSIILAYSKLNSVGFIKDSSKEKFKNGLNKLLNAAMPPSAHNIGQLNLGALMTAITFAPSVSPSPAANFQTMSLKLENGHRKNQARNSNDSASPDEDETVPDDPGDKKTFSKPVECIEVFADSLDFCLKLLKHETLILDTVFSDSAETLSELTSKSTIMVIDLIQTEFEKFLTNACDFTKTSNSGDDVLLAIMMLIKKVKHLKEKACCLQSEDLSSAAKFLSFSIRLNELGAQIFSAYIDVVKTGHFSEFSMPTNCSIHERTIKTCEILGKMSADQAYLIETLRIVYETRLSKSKDDDKSEVESENDKDEDLIEVDEAAENEGEEEEDGPETVDSKSKSKNPFKRIKKLRRLRDRLRNSSSTTSLVDDAEYSSRIYFVKYAEVVAQRLHGYFASEILKEHKNLSQLSASVSLASLTSVKMTPFSVFNPSKDSSTQAIRTSFRKFKSYIFFLNNIEYMMDSLDRASLLKDAVFGLEARLNKSIQECIDKACDVFRLVEKKWKSITAEITFMAPTSTPRSRGSLFRKFSSVSESTELPTTDQKVGQAAEPTDGQHSDPAKSNLKPALKTKIKKNT